MPIKEGSFIVEYRGVLRNASECTPDAYSYYFLYKNASYCIDASLDDGSLGRLVNDDSNPNAKVKITSVNCIPHLCLFALRDIQPGEEITYDYGGYDLPWRRGTWLCTEKPSHFDNNKEEQEARTKESASQTENENEFEKEEPERADKSTQTTQENTSAEEIIWNYIPYHCLTSEHQKMIENQLLRIQLTPPPQQIPVDDDTRISKDPSTSRQLPSDHEVTNQPPPKDVSAVNEQHVSHEEASESLLSNQITDEVRERECHEEAEKLPCNEWTNPPLCIKDTHTENEQLILKQHHTSMDTEPCVEESCLIATEQQTLEQQLTNTQQCEEPSGLTSTAQSMCEEVQLAGQDKPSQIQTDEETPQQCNDACQNATQADQNSELSNEESNDEMVSSDEEFIPDSDTETNDDSDMEKKNKTPVASGVEEQAKPSTQNYSVTQTTKLNFCFVCGNAYSKISRHLKMHIKDNKEIATAFKLRKNSKERLHILEVLRNRGNYKHNNSVLTKGSGQIKAKRTPKTDIDPQKFEYCMYCKGLYSRKMLWKHVKRCTSNPEKEAPKNSRYILGLAALSQCPHLQNISEDLKKMLCDMHQDEVAQLVRNDEYVLKLAQDFYNKKGNSKENHAFIRHTIRCLGKFLVLLQNKSTIRNLAEAIKPSNFPKIIETVKEIAEYNDVTKCYAIPSLARRIGLALRKYCVLTAQKAFAVKDRILIQSTCRFTELFNNAKSEFALGEIVSPGKFLLLPFITDVRKLHCFLEKAGHCAVRELRKTPTAQNYAELCKVTLAQILLFNRRHGEVSQMTIKSFQERDQTHPNEISKHLSEMENVFCADYCKILVRQKVGALVPIILTPDMINALMLLTEMRERCSVLKSNIFVFGQPKSNKCYRGENALRICARECGATNPDNLTSIKFSRHISTLTQFLTLKNNELKNLAKFIGHDISLQKEYYRQSEAVPRLTKICKLLLAIEKGKAADVLKHSLDAIQLPEEINESESEDEYFEEDNAFFEDPFTRYKLSIHNMSGTKTFTTNYGVSEPKRMKPDNESASEEPQNESTSKELQDGSTSKEKEKSILKKKRIRPTTTKSKGNHSKKKNKQQLGTVKKKMWSKEEQNAIMKHFKRHIYYGRLATIKESRRCLMLEQPVLDGRTVQKIRDFVRNAGISFKKKMSLKNSLKSNCPTASQPAKPNSKSDQPTESKGISTSSKPSSPTTNPTNSSVISPKTTGLIKPIIIFPQNANLKTTTTLPSQVKLSTTLNEAHPQAKLIYIKVQADQQLAQQTTACLPLTSQAANPGMVPAGLMLLSTANPSISSANVLQIPQVANSGNLLPQVSNLTSSSQEPLQSASLICGGVLVPQTINPTTCNILTLPAAHRKGFTTVPSQIRVLDKIPPPQAANISNIGIITTKPTPTALM